MKPKNGCKVEQRSDEWFKARLGCATASCFSKVLAKGKGGGQSLTRESYMLQLMAEKLTQQATEKYSNEHMSRGTMLEAVAVEEYEIRTGRLVISTGFHRHPSLACGASPDGFVEEGQIEIKCPKSETHLTTWECGMSPSHQPQVQGQMWITGRPWCDFISFDDRLPKDLQLYVERVLRDDAYIAELEKEVKKFLEELTERLNHLNRKAANV